MTTLLIAEHDNASIKDATNKALTAAAALGADVHVLVAGENDVGVVGPDSDVRALAAADRVALGGGNEAGGAPAGRCDGGVVLLAGVGPVGIAGVQRHVVELSRRLVVDR